LAQKEFPSFREGREKEDGRDHDSLSSGPASLKRGQKYSYVSSFAAGEVGKSLWSSRKPPSKGGDIFRVRCQRWNRYDIRWPPGGKSKGA